MNRPTLTTALAEHRFDFVLALALAALLHGIARIYAPAAWIAGGLALAIWAVLGDVARLRRTREPDDQL